MMKTQKILKYLLYLKLTLTLMSELALVTKAQPSQSYWLYLSCLPVTKSDALFYHKVFSSSNFKLKSEFDRKEPPEQAQPLFIIKMQLYLLLVVPAGKLQPYFFWLRKHSVNWNVF